jgi:hypothetical protein
MAGVASLKTLRNPPDSDKWPSSIVHIYHKATTPLLPSLPTSQTPTNLSLTRIHNRTSSQKILKKLWQRLLQVKITRIGRKPRDARSVQSEKENAGERTGKKRSETRRKSQNSKIKNAKLYRSEEEPEKNRARFRQKLNHNGRERDRNGASRFLEERGRILREMEEIFGKRNGYCYGYGYSSLKIWEWESMRFSYVYIGFSSLSLSLSFSLSLSVGGVLFGRLFQREEDFGDYKTFLES